MVERVKVGDTVRVTSVVEGVVTRIHGGDDFEVEGPHYFAGRTDTEVERTVTVLEPKGYPVGSVAYDGKYPLIRQQDGWYGPIALRHGAKYPTRDDQWVYDRGCVVYEPPTS